MVGFNIFSYGSMTEAQRSDILVTVGDKNHAIFVSSGTQFDEVLAHIVES